MDQGPSLPTTDVKSQKCSPGGFETHPSSNTFLQILEIEILRVGEDLAGIVEESELHRRPGFPAVLRGKIEQPFVAKLKLRESPQGFVAT